MEPPRLWQFGMAFLGTLLVVDSSRLEGGSASLGGGLRGQGGNMAIRDSSIRACRAAGVADVERDHQPQLAPGSKHCVTPPRIAATAAMSSSDSGSWSFVAAQRTPVHGGHDFPSVRYSASAVQYRGEMIVTHGYFYNRARHPLMPSPSRFRFLARARPVTDARWSHWCVPSA